MEIKETTILEKLFWPEGKENLLGNLSFNMTNEDMSHTYEINASRTNDKIEVFFASAPTFTPDNKTYFVQLTFDKKGQELFIDKEKTSPELSTLEEVMNTLDSIQNNIIKMNSKPDFFPTGVENQPARKLVM